MIQLAMVQSRVPKFKGQIIFIFIFFSCTDQMSNLYNKGY